MSRENWGAIDDYITGLLLPRDPVLDAVREANAAAGLPPHDVSPPQGKLLMLLARAISARAILEVGTLGGYSGIWLARGLADGGRLVTLELDAERAAIARANFARAGLAASVEVIAGAAADSLRTLAAERRGPFDLIFIDADKENNPEYFTRALELSRPGSLIVVDNVVRAGAVLDSESADPIVRGVRRLNELIAAEPRVSATAIQTVGGKGHDGMAIALVLGS